MKYQITKIKCPTPNCGNTKPTGHVIEEGFGDINGAYRAAQYHNDAYKRYNCGCCCEVIEASE